VTTTIVDKPLATAIHVLEAEAEAIRSLISRIGTPFMLALGLTASCKGKIAVTGLGKSGLICQKIAATLSSTGSPAMFLHAGDALHGDCGLLAANDLVLAISKSGETEEVLQVLNMAKRLGLPVIAMAGNGASTLAQYADVFLDVSVAEEACPFGLAPTTSTAAALAMGDALAMALMEIKGFGKDDFASLHPAGSIGKRLMRVRELMHRGAAIPFVLESTPMSDAIFEMTQKGLGMTVVASDEGELRGLISDGDLRRLLNKSTDPLKMKAGQVMSRTPKTISPDELATVALSKMEEKKITSLVVINENKKVVGVVHLHDLWRTELF
jgi:arabinose-5-phosphate isomerase